MDGFVGHVVDLNHQTTITKVSEDVWREASSFSIDPNVNLERSIQDESHISKLSGSPFFSPPSPAHSLEDLNTRRGKAKHYFSPASSIYSNHSISSRSILSKHRAARNNSSHKIAYLDDESSLQAEAEIFTVRTSAKSSKLVGNSLDAWLEQERAFTNMAASCANFDVIKDPRRDHPSSSETTLSDTCSLSWSPDWKDADVVSNEASQTKEPACTAKFISIQDEDEISQLSCEPMLRSDQSLSTPNQGEGSPTKHSKQGRKSLLHMISLIRPRSRPQMRKSAKESLLQDLNFSMTESSASSAESLSNIQNPEGIPRWYRASDTPFCDPLALSDWTIMVVHDETTMEKVDTYHVHRSSLEYGPYFSAYFRRKFQRYDKARQLGKTTAAYSLVRLDPALAESFPDLLNFVYSGASTQFIVDMDCSWWENLDRSSLMALRKLARRFEVAELELLMGPCNV